LLYKIIDVLVSEIYSFKKYITPVYLSSIIFYTFDKPITNTMSNENKKSIDDFKNQKVEGKDKKGGISGLLSTWINNIFPVKTDNVMPPVNSDLLGSPDMQTAPDSGFASTQQPNDIMPNIDTADQVNSGNSGGI
jgi:hypothetical protein